MVSNKEPAKFSHKLMTELIGASFDEPLSVSPETLEVVSKVFVQAGGSWEKLTLGSVDDLTLLKKCLKVALSR